LVNTSYILTNRMIPISNYKKYILEIIAKFIVQYNHENWDKYKLTKE